jgi:hypothetical protein
MSMGVEIPETVVIGEDDTIPLTIYAKNEDGTAYVLTSLTVAFYMAAPGSATKKAGGACTVTDGPNGICTYAWATNETDTPGTYYAALKITTSGSKIVKSRRFIVEIQKKIPEA